MKGIKIEIETVNSAFEGAEFNEVARILRELADNLDRYNEVQSLRDINGNKTGKVEYL